MAYKVLFEEDVNNKFKEPKLYTVIFHNDSITTMDFVVFVIVEVFGKNTYEATQIMMSIHENGKAALGSFSYDIAMSKKIRVDKLSAEKKFPLKVTVEMQ